MFKQNLLKNIDESLVEQASAALSKNNINLDDALTSFLTEIVYKQDLPFKPTFNESNADLPDEVEQNIIKSMKIKKVADEVIKGPVIEGNKNNLEKLESKNQDLKDKKQSINDLKDQHNTIKKKVLRKAQKLEETAKEEKRLVETVLQNRVEELMLVESKLKDYAQMMTSDDRFHQNGEYWSLFQECLSLIKRVEKMSKSIEDLSENEWCNGMLTLNKVLKDLAPVLDEVFPNPLIKTE